VGEIKKKKKFFEFFD
jgi:hypothetical protein